MHTVAVVVVALL